MTIIAMMLQMILLPAVVPIALSCFIFGFGSGAAMIPYSIIKEVNQDGVKGSATGAMNFMTFGVSAIIGPVFAKLVGPGLLHPTNPLYHFQASLCVWMGGTVLALVLAVPLRETVRPSVRMAVTLRFALVMTSLPSQRTIPRVVKSSRAIGCDPKSGSIHFSALLSTDQSDLSNANNALA